MQQELVRTLESGEKILARHEYNPDTHYLIHISLFPNSEAEYRKMGITHLVVSNVTKWFPSSSY